MHYNSINLYRCQVHIVIYLPVLTVRPKQVQQITESVSAVVAIVLLVSVEEGLVTGV